METIEYRTQDKSDWGNGEWHDEPDKKQWLDEATGYPCLIVRNRLGSLCGYVGVPKDHPFFEQDYGNPTVDVHGGLTFADRCRPEGDESRGICHKINGEDHVWWFGFDCSHAWDISPVMELRERGLKMEPNRWEHQSYKNLAYVTCQVESLAKQLKAMAA